MEQREKKEAENNGFIFSESRTDGAARAKWSLLRLCRVATEEEEFTEEEHRYMLKKTFSRREKFFFFLHTARCRKKKTFFS